MRVLLIFITEKPGDLETCGLITSWSLLSHHCSLSSLTERYPDKFRENNKMLTNVSRGILFLNKVEKGI